MLKKMASLWSSVKVSFRNVNPSGSLSCARSISMNNPLHGYDPDGKTVINILNNENDAPLMIDSYSLAGFRLNNGLFVVGPLAIFPSSVLSWNIKDDHDINERSLSLFLHLAPKLDILVIGLSDARDQKHISKTRSYVYNLLKTAKQGENMNIEVLPTEKAVTTFNFLNSENRFVAAALVPPTFYSPTQEDLYQIEYLKRKKLEKGYFIES